MSKALNDIEFYKRSLLEELLNKCTNRQKKLVLPHVWQCRNNFARKHRLQSWGFLFKAKDINGKESRYQITKMEHMYELILNQ